MMLLMMMMVVVLMLMIKMMMLLLIILVQLAGRLGIGKLWVKDESYRFNLKAFKAVGSSYALARSLMGEGIWPIRHQIIYLRLFSLIIIIINMSQFAPPYHCYHPHKHLH